MFKVRATVLEALGDIEKYPCHFNYEPGDQIIFTGAELQGRVCPAVLPVLADKIEKLYNAGPRYIESGYYLPFWYCSASVSDPSMKKYDGNGFKPVLETLVEPRTDMANLRDPRSFTWPPADTRRCMKEITFICPDQRTSLPFVLEAFDLADDGDCLPYFRREMKILDKLRAKPEGIETAKLLDEYDDFEKFSIHPPLSPVLLICLTEELELLDYIVNEDGRFKATEKGLKKLQDFIGTLTAEEREAQRY